jgi:site-specific recombinase XerD
MTINIIRRFHNYIGKPYVDIKLDEIKGYLNFLSRSEQYTYKSIIRHLTAIKMFYDYLELRGEISKNPFTEGSYQVLQKRLLYA